MSKAPKMNIQQYLLFLLVLIVLNNGASESPSSWKTDKIALKYGDAQELLARGIADTFNIIATKCWDENAIIISGPSQKIISFITFIKTQVDIPHQLPGGRRGDNILSK